MIIIIMIIAIMTNTYCRDLRRREIRPKSAQNNMRILPPGPTIITTITIIIIIIIIIISIIMFTIITITVTTTLKLL